MHAHAVRRRSATPGSPAPGSAARESDAHQVRAQRSRHLVEAGPQGLARLGRPAVLPFREQLERSFGTDLSDVRVRVGATDEMADLGAGAATMASTVVFGNDRPSLHEVAHEVTHVLQNRAARPAGGVVSTPSQAAEVEAESAGAAVTAGGSAEVTSAPAAPLQLGPLDWLKKKLSKTPQKERRGLQDSDLVEGGQTMGEGGTLNRVDRVEYKRSIGKDTGTTGFFKPDAVRGTSKSVKRQKALDKKYDQVKDNSVRSVASSRLDRKLGFHQLSREKFAVHNGEKGSVSAALPSTAQPLMINDFQTRAGEEEQGKTGNGYKQRDGITYKRSHSDRVDHDFSHPVTQKTMFDLQLQDAIVGQYDRHGGNIFVDSKTGKTHGIDNDMSFDRGEDRNGYQAKYLNDVGDGAFSKYQGLPELVDKQSAKRVLQMKSKTFAKTIRGKEGDPARMSEETVQQATHRFKDVKKHLKQLKKDKKLVKEWGQDTFQSALQGGPSYLKNAQNALTSIKNGTSTSGRVRGLDGTLPVPVLPQQRRSQELELLGN